MRTSVKTPLVILSALALLAGCVWVWDTTRPKTGPKTGYLHFDDDSATFVKWTQEGQKLEGTIDAVYRKPDGNAGRAMFLFHGALNGEMVSLALNSSGTAQERFQTMDKTITGTLRGDTLALLFGDGANVAQPIAFRPASDVEFLVAALKLQKVRATTTAKQAYDRRTRQQSVEGHEERGEAMKLSDLTPEEREEIIRMTKESHPGVELTADAEVDYFLFPFPKDREVMAIDKAQEIWEAQAQRAASEWQAEPGSELGDFLRIVNRAFDRIPVEALRALNPEGRCLFRDEFENTVRDLL